MKGFCLVFLWFTAIQLYGQHSENIIVVTTDGLRWQEVFKGLDTALANQKNFNEGDSAYIYTQYYDQDEIRSRAKLMPFMWSVMEKGGQIYGNRQTGNQVNVSNPYWFSYPGYNEILTGYADTLINRNDYPPNPHVTVLEFLHRQAGFKNKVAVFGAWEAFNRIINEKRSGIPVMAAYDKIGGARPTTRQQLLNRLLQDSYKPWLNDECLDVFTHYAAMETLKTGKPRVLYIAYGETDEWAHAGKYRSYLDAARQVDAWIKQLWEQVQADPRYRDKTTLLITTDHGRGGTGQPGWTSHGTSVEGSDAIWFAVMGPGIKPGGAIHAPGQYYQKQFAQTIARILGFQYTADHPVAPALDVLFK